MEDEPGESTDHDQEYDNVEEDGTKIRRQHWVTSFDQAISTTTQKKYKAIK